MAGWPSQGVSPARNWRTTSSRASSHQVGSSSGNTPRSSNPACSYHAIVRATSVDLRIAVTLATAAVSQLAEDGVPRLDDHRAVALAALEDEGAVLDVVRRVGLVQEAERVDGDPHVVAAVRQVRDVEGLPGDALVVGVAPACRER